MQIKLVQTGVLGHKPVGCRQRVIQCRRTHVRNLGSRFWILRAVDEDSEYEDAEVVVGAPADDGSFDDMAVDPSLSRSQTQDFMFPTDRQGIHDVYVKLKEDDIDYSKLKAYCRQLGLGGKDTKDNMRAKLLKVVRDRLGMTLTWQGREVDLREFKTPDKMRDAELEDFFKKMDVVQPEYRYKSEDFAYALMVAYGVIDIDDVPPENKNYSNMSVEQMRQRCRELKLLSTGRREDLENRLINCDKLQAEQEARERNEEAFKNELASADVDRPPMCPNQGLREQLTIAQEEAKIAQALDLPTLRMRLLRRGLPVYGTKDVLLDRQMDMLRKNIIEALGGSTRLMQYAQAAVMKLSPLEIEQELEHRGLMTDFVVEEEAARVLRNSLVDDWVERALSGELYKATDASLGSSKYGGLMDDEEDYGNNEQLLEQGGLEDEEVYAERGDEEEEEQEGGEPEGYEQGQAMSIALVCGGYKTEQRETSLASARVALQQLQTCEIWGTKPPVQPDLMMYLDDIEGDANGVAPEISTNFAEEPFLGNNGCTANLVPVAERDCSYAVLATPLDEASGAQTVLFSSPTPTVQMNGLRPDTAYRFTPYIRNAAGLGPAGEPYDIATASYSGTVCWVYYPYEVSPGQWQYTRLSWKELHSCSAAELDARLALSGATPLASITADQLPNEVDVVLPLGVLSTAFADEEQSWQYVADRKAFVDAISSMGFAAGAVLSLTRDEVQASVAKEDGAVEKRVNEWLASQGLEPQIVSVAVRVEVGGEVVGAGVGRGEEVVTGALALMEAFNSPTILVQPLIPGAVFVTCTVLSTPQGPVALAPTELDIHDIEHDLAIGELRFEKFLALKDGMAEEAASALCALWQHDIKVHPEMVGGPSSPTEETRFSTPPRSLSAEASQTVRSTAVKLFQSLGLKDYAQFSGWVVPDNPYEVAGLEGTRKLIESAREAAKSNGNNGNGNGATPKATSFADLLAIDAEERANRDSRVQQLVATADATALEVTEQNIAQVARDDAGSSIKTFLSENSSAAMAPIEANPDEIGPYGVRYGDFGDIKLDDSTRMDLLAADPAIPCKPIPNERPPLPEISTLEAATLEATNPVQVSQKDGYKVAFDRLQLYPNLAAQGGVLYQQAAAAGLSLETITKAVVSSAASRVGLPPLPLHQSQGGSSSSSADGDLDNLGWRPGRAALSHSSDMGSLFSSGTEDGSDDDVDIEDIGRAILEWDNPRIPEPISYEDILDGEEDTIPAAASIVDELDMAAELLSDDVLLNREGLGGSSDVDNDDDDEYGLVDEEEDSVAILARRFPGLHPTKQRVWVLIGGEGPARNAGLQSALNAVSVLCSQPDLHVEAFLLEPPHCGLRDEERRQTLIQRRADMRELGATDDQLMAGFVEYHPSRIKNPEPPPPEELEWRGVWALGSCTTVRPTVTDMHVACETSLTHYGAADWSREVGDSIHGIDSMTHVVKSELKLGGIQVGRGQGPWGGSELENAEVPEYCFLDAWLDAAAQQCAVVLLAVPSHPSAQGPLQAALESKGVPFTGSSSIAADLCADRAELLKRVSEMAYHGSGISTPPFHTISLPELAAKCETEAAADELVARLSEHWGITEKPLVIRPAKDTGGVGIARIATGADLQQYAYAVQAWEDVIPAGALSLETSDVQMAFPPPTGFVLEPCAEVQPPEVTITVGSGAGGSGDVVVGADGVLGTDPSGLYGALTQPESWLRVTACVLGSLTYMQSLGLTTPVQCIVKGADGTEQQSIIQLTPPPSELLPPRVAGKARNQLLQMALNLGITGTAELTAMVNASTGELVILEVDLQPDLSPQGVLMRQAAVIDSNNPMSPGDVLRELLKVGMSKGEGGVFKEMLPYKDDFAQGIEELLSVNPPQAPSAGVLKSPYDYGLSSIDDEADDI